MADVDFSEAEVIGSDLTSSTVRPEGFPHVRRFLSSHAWAMEESAFYAMVEVLERRMSGVRLSAEEIEARTGGRQARKPASRVGAVAVLPIHGAMTQHGDLIDGTSIPTISTAAIASTMREFAGSDEVGSVVLEFDSPGGSVYGLQEASQAIRDASKAKPVTAVVNSQAGSAAYWLASQAGEVVVAPGSDVGGIGIFIRHDDESEAAAAAGVKVTYISAGKHKTEGNPFEPLSDEARDFFQQRANEAYGEFVAAVATGRGVSQKRVREGFGEGRMVAAKHAVAAGMADRIGTLDEVVNELASGQARKRQARSRQAQARARMASLRL